MGGTNRCCQQVRDPPPRDRMSYNAMYLYRSVSEGLIGQNFVVGRGLYWCSVKEALSYLLCIRCLYLRLMPLTYGNF